MARRILVPRVSRDWRGLAVPSDWPHGRAGVRTCCDLSLWCVRLRKDRYHGPFGTDSEQPVTARKTFLTSAIPAMMDGRRTGPERHRRDDRRRTGAEQSAATDAPAAAAARPVRVTIRVAAPVGAVRGLADVIREIAAEQRSRGFPGRSAEDLRAEDDLRLAEDAERARELDSA